MNRTDIVLPYDDSTGSTIFVCGLEWDKIGLKKKQILKGGEMCV